MAQENLIAELKGYLRSKNSEVQKAVIAAVRGGYESAKDVAKSAKKGELALTSGESMDVHICLRAMYPKIKAWDKAQDMLDKATENLTKKNAKDIKRRMRRAGDLQGLKEMMEMCILGEDKKAEMVEAIYDNPNDFTEDVRIGTVAAWLECKNKKSERYHHRMSESGSMAMELEEAHKASHALEKMSAVTPLKEEGKRLRQEAEMLEEMARVAYGTRMMQGQLQMAISGIGEKVNSMTSIAMNRSVSSVLIMLLVSSLVEPIHGESVEEFCMNYLNITHGKVYVHCYNEDDGKAMAIVAILLSGLALVYLIAKVIGIAFVWMVTGETGRKFSDAWYLLFSAGRGDEDFERDLKIVESRSVENIYGDDGGNESPNTDVDAYLGFESDGVLNFKY
uniref:Polyprotein p42 n=1 Tax=Ornate chorus frog influenza-like virus TaxID=2777033 RepID=A0A866VYW8_9ORTO|nr:matrix protein [Ornate chorus frog influenza-like virus]